MPSHSRIASSAALILLAAGLITAPITTPAVANPAGTSLVISEVYGAGGNAGAAYINDFVELYNPTDAPISVAGMGLKYLPAAPSGASQVQTLALSGSVAAKSHFLIQLGSGGTVGGALPTPDATGGINMAATAGQVWLSSDMSTTRPPANVVDFVGFGTSATTYEGTGPAAAPSAGASTARAADGRDTDDNKADFTAGAPTPKNSGAGGTDPNPDPGAETLMIAEIQGTGPVSPKIGVTATTTGVVTAKFPTGGFNGFYLQTGGPDTTPDASDGLFIYAPGKDQSTFDVGDTLTVTGKVSEFGSMTQVTADSFAKATSAQPSVVPKTVIPGTDCPLPGDTCLAGAELESAREEVEGESFKPTAPYTLTDVYDGSAYNGGSPSSNFFGELGLAGNSDIPLMTPTEVARPGTLEVAARIRYNNAHRVILDDGSSTTYWNTSNTGKMDQPLPWFTPQHQPRVGAKLTFSAPVVLDYRFGWKLQPQGQVVGAPTADQVVIEQTRKATPEPVGGDLKLATFNVLNYFTTLGTDRSDCNSYNDRAGNPIAVSRCTGANGPRGAWNQASFERQQTKVVTAINAMDADVVSLEEIENSKVVDGHDRDEAIGALVTALNAAAGSTRWAYVPSPSVLPTGEDVIRTGLIYDPSTVETVGAAQLHSAPAFDNAREPLAQAFKPKGAPAAQTFVAIVNHFKSKGSGVDDGTGQGNANPDRVAQAHSLAAFATSFAQSRGTDKVFLTGDFNAYSMEDPIKVLTDAGYKNLESSTNPHEKTYSFDGASGSLDHVLASSAAAAWVKGVDIWEINANETVFNQYSRFNYNVTELYQPGSFSASDHNPEIVGITPTGTAPEPSKPVVTTTVAPVSIKAQTESADVTASVTLDGIKQSGLVTAKVDGRIVGGGELVDGTVTFPVGPFATAGIKAIELTYRGAEGVTATATTSVTVTAAPVVVKGTSTVLATLTPASVAVGSGRATAQIQVTKDLGKDTGEATGPVLAVVDGQVIGAGLLSGGKTTIHLPVFDTAGTKTVTFTYTGDDTTKPSSTTASLTVVTAPAPAAPILTASVSQSSIKAQTESTTVTVKVSVPGATPTGLVTASVDGRIVGGGALSNGTANLPVGPFATTGQKTITVTYQGVSTTTSVTVTPAPTVEKASSTIAGTVSPGSVRVKSGRAVASVTVIKAGGEATGPVLAIADGQVIGAGVLSGGKADIALAPFVATGSKTVNLQYFGDDTTKGSSTTTTVEVTKGKPKLRIKAPKRATVGEKLTLTVTVSADGVAPTGTVRITVTTKGGKAKTITRTLRDGRAAASLRVRQPGKHKITVSYAGDPDTDGAAQVVKLRAKRG